ncbi:hypothetical protein GCM10010358_76110 [Streptomyces minutiscleroticus]|uniref:Uncharacterized protein n=1 Tax=Streptomyces minutiscleroticus TaxID=68238 RepID=A0A918U9B3_9ACTN|nr:hypothetical protein GCM10010358_76110 [Streptomyces minutiscleroticus]
MLVCTDQCVTGLPTAKSPSSLRVVWVFWAFCCIRSLSFDEEFGSCPSWIASGQRGMRVHGEAESAVADLPLCVPWRVPPVIDDLAIRIVARARKSKQVNVFGQA